MFVAHSICIEWLDTSDSGCWTLLGISINRAFFVWLPALGLEVFQQPVEELLIRDVLLPLGKVADMAMASG